MDSFLTGWNFAALLLVGAFIFGVISKLKTAFPEAFKLTVVNRFKPFYAILAGMLICIIPGIIEGDLTIYMKLFLGANAGLYSQFLHSVFKKFIKNQITTQTMTATEYNSED